MVGRGGHKTCSWDVYLCLIMRVCMYACIYAYVCVCIGFGSWKGWAQDMFVGCISVSDHMCMLPCMHEYFKCMHSMYACVYVCMHA